jgi:hypothetical protein
VAADESSAVGSVTRKQFRDALSDTWWLVANAAAGIIALGVGAMVMAVGGLFVRLRTELVRFAPA